MRRRALIVGNWKMNGLVETALELTESLLTGVAKREKKKLLGEVVVCPPFTALSAVNNILGGSSIKLGGQNMSAESSGAFTGEICGIMLRNVGCRYVILGHSERRRHFGETDLDVGRKVAAAFRDGLNPIICVGEDMAQREAGSALDAVDAQIQALAPFLPEKTTKQNQMVIAYEPVWAIGSGQTPTPQQISEMHVFIRDRLDKYMGADETRKVRILYGGSLKPENAAAIFSVDNVDGGLVGGSSLSPQDFLAIIDAYPTSD
ncbi:MAG: triose-phosphate isomerase [Magnetococcales bacterium]|nr:triose-phosphate isomerase [Magnetococcales bacterium]